MFGRRRNEQEGIIWYGVDEGLSDVEIQDNQEILAAVGTHACKGCETSVVAIHAYCSGCLGEMKEQAEQAKADQSARRAQKMQKWLSDQFNRGY